MQTLQKLINRQDLTEEEIEGVMNEIMTGKLSEAEIAAFLVALQSKGPTVDEIASCAKIMRQHACKIEPNVEKLVDTCGTGGDSSGTFNISTTVAFVVAGCKVAVAKHGNKAASSQCGSADVLELLGVKIDLLPDQVKKCIEEIGIGFMYAPIFHPAMKHVMPVRKILKVRTIFNILGPLTNPANAKHQVLGVYDERLTEIMAKVLRKLEVKHALVVYGDGLDEITTSGNTKISELVNEETKTYELSPTDLKLKIFEQGKLKGGTPEQNARILKSILKGNKGPKRDIVVINAAAALLAADEAIDFREGVLKARKSIDSGEAMAKLEELIEFSNK